MSTFNEMMQKWVNTDYDTLVALAKEAVVRVMPACKRVDPKYNGNYMLTALLLSAVGADGVFSGLENKMLQDVMGLDEEDVKKLISMYDRRMADLADNFADNMSGDTKADVIMLVSAFASVDERINAEETAFIKKLFA